MPQGTPEASLSQELVQRVQAGDREAWGRLYRRYHDPLLLAIRARLGSGLRAWLQSEDILHSVIKDAFDDLGGFEHRGEGTLEHWLHVCVLNKIRSKAAFYGSAKRAGEERASTSELDHLSGRAGEPAYHDAQTFGRLERGMAALPEEQREVVLLRAIERLPNERVAELLGKTPAATSKLYNRALARLGGTGLGPE
jgi:RNA polymerase sigma factor (sigma-70 family)